MDAIEVSCACTAMLRWPCVSWSDKGSEVGEKVGVGLHLLAERRASRGQVARVSEGVRGCEGVKVKDRGFVDWHVWASSLEKSPFALFPVSRKEERKRNVGTVWEMRKMIRRYFCGILIVSLI